MNMNVNPVGFGAKLPLSRIKLARNVNNQELPVDDYVKTMLSEHGDKVEKVANYLGRDVVLAQKGNLLLANSGAKTTAIDMSKMEKGEDLIDGIIHNLKINA